MNGMIIYNPGMLSSLQDLGRTGYQKYGVIASGVMDEWSARSANLLVGNQESEAVLEMTFLGPSLELMDDSWVAITGGNLHPTIDGEEVPMWRPVYLPKGKRLEFGSADSEGCRAYLAVRGGFDVPIVMGSKSTYLRAALGGYEGRALKKGDQIPIGESSPSSYMKWMKKKLVGSFWAPWWAMAHPNYAALGETIEIRVTVGPQKEWFTDEAITKFFEMPFEISEESDRMGYRLKGEKIERVRSEDMISEAIGFGSVQIPPDGNPIILLADRQTAGGYPKIGQIAKVDLPLLAQLMPGTLIRFRLISFNEAESLLVMSELEMEKQRVAIHYSQREDMLENSQFL